MLPARTPPVYSRAEYVSDAVVHVAGIAAAFAGVPVLVTLAAIWFGDAGTVTAIAVYGVCMIAMLSCSALYNMVPGERWSDVLRRIDQSAIYLKIAGTYTPFIALTGASLPFLVFVWAVAAFGAALILLSPGPVRVASLLLYLGLGWAGAVGGGPLVSGLTTAGFALLLAGGVLYTAGVIFLLWERLPFHNTIWHVFVLAATGVCYAAVLVELAGRAIPG